MAEFPNITWSEREAGDWEACVVTAYAMGLIHGGVKMAAPYTQTERERLEKVPDSPQDLNTTDAMSLQVYGKQLRKLSTGTISHAVTRVHVGLCLTGNGSPGRQWVPGFTGLHEVFYVPTSSASGYLGDPLAPNGLVFQLIRSSTIVAWAKGAGPNDAREVKLNEFAPPAPQPLYTQDQVDRLLELQQGRWETWLKTHPTRD